MTAPPARNAVRLADGRRLAIEVEGAARGETPVLLIGPLGGSMALWGEFRSRLAERARVICFDRAGAGASTGAAFLDGTRDMARDALAVLDHLGVARAHVFGISLGGMVATWLAIDEPARAASLCLASTAASGFDLSRAVARGASFAACLLRGGSRVQPCLARRVLSRQFRAEHPERVAEIEGLLVFDRARRAEIMKQVGAALRHDARAGLHRIRARTLVLAGDLDDLIGRARQEALAREIPGARFEVVAGAGHAITLEQPLSSAERVSRFFFDEQVE